MSSRRRILASAAIVLVAGGATTIVLVQSGGHPATAAGASVPAGFTTATVERRTLTERSTVDGTLGYAGAAEIYDRLAGTYTWLPPVGAVIGRGGTLFKVDNMPIALMYGSVPAYRTLQEGISDGPDVRELDANLVALGYDPAGEITVDEHFGEATAAAVRRWQHAEGLVQTGEVQLGRIVFAPGARRVTTVHVVVGQDPPGASTGSAASPGASNPAQGSSGSSGTNGSSTSDGSPGSNGSTGSHPRSASPNKGSGSRSGSGSHTPASGSGGSRSRSGSSGSHPNGTAGSGASSGAGESGDGGAGSGSKEGSSSGGKEGSGGGGAPVLVLSTTADTQIVSLQLKATQEELAHVGERVPVALPDGGTVRGRVSEVGTVASESSGEGSAGSGGSGGGGSGGGGSGAGGSGNGENAMITVKVTLDHPVARLDKAPVSVELVKAIRRDVLAVPATALVATAGGGFAVQAFESGRRVEVPVTPGMFANGYVQVEGGEISEGMSVLEPR